MKNVSAWVIAGLCILLLVSVVANFVQASKKCPPLAISGNMPKSLPSVPFETRTDSAGRNHVILDREATQQIKQEATTVASRILNIPIDSLAIYYDIKAKNIDGAMVIETKSYQERIKFLSKKIDSLNRQVYSYQDDYLSLTMRSPAPDDTVDHGEFDFDYNADLRFLDYHTRDKILGLRIGKKRYFTDISSSDPRTTIRGVEKFTIQRRVPSFGFRVQARTGYNWETNSFSSGVGLRFDIGDRLKTGVNYIYSFTLQRWQPITYAEFDILQFGR